MAIRLDLPSAVREVDFKTHMKGMLLNQALPPYQLTTSIPKDAPGLFCRNPYGESVRLPAKKIGLEIKDKVVAIFQA